MNPYDPFSQWRRNFSPMQPTAQPINSASIPSGNLNQVANAVVSAPKTQAEFLGLTEGASPKKTAVTLPPHLYIPEGAISIDIIRVCIVLPGTVLDTLMSFQAPDGVITNFIQYGLFNEGEEESLFEFRPEVNGERVYPYHGDPNNNFKIAMGTSADLGLNAMRYGYLQMQPLSEIRWRVTNASTIARVMGVRMIGYFMSSQVREATRFGG